MIEEKTLQERASELFGERGKHDNKAFPNLDCAKCGAKAMYGIDALAKRDGPCPIPDPVNINDWNEVMKMRDMAISKTNEFVPARIAVYKKFKPEECKNLTPDQLVDATDLYFVSFATPEDYAEAACLAMESL